MVSQLQVLNKILNTKDFSVVILNNLNEDYFFNYKNEFNYIKTHVEANRTVPDKLTFASVFPKFELQEVNEPDSYLLEELFNDYNHAYLASEFNSIKKLLENGNVKGALELYQNGIDGLRQGGAIQSVNLMKDTSRFDRYKQKVNGDFKYYLSTGFPELDQILGGIDRENEDMVISARPGQGKTQIMLAIACALSKQGLTVGIYEGEMTHDKIGYRIDTFLGHIKNTSMNRGDSSIEKDYGNYIESLKDANLGPIKIITQNDISGEPTVDALRAFIKKEKLDVLFVDQYSLLEDKRHGKTEFERVGNIAKDIKLLQVETGIPIISVSQMNRTKNENGEQDTTQVAGSDKIGQYATVVIMLEQKTIELNGQKAMQLTLNITKARDGGNGNKLCYVTDFNTGTFHYIPQQTDGVATKESLSDLKNSYESEQPF